MEGKSLFKKRKKGLSMNLAAETFMGKSKTRNFSEVIGNLYVQVSSVRKQSQRGSESVSF